ncbi:MAG TPA: sensor domain-containing diguanylate cyclase [Nocardioidaceae bacterium]|nr:sensor domain-containing diguanylate cyclase [Nocardioidaceae bacterium]
MDAPGEGGVSDPPRAPAPGMSLDERAEMFAGIATTSPDAVVVSDLDGAIVWANPAAAAMFGWPVEELLGRPFTVLLPEQAHARVRTLTAGVLDGQPAPPFATTGVRRSGETFELSLAAGVRRDRDGRPLGTHMVMRDVTEEAHLRRELTETLARSRARFDQSAHPQAMLDVDGRILEVNDAGCALLGLPRDDLVGRDVTSLVDPADRERVRHGLGELRGGQVRELRLETTGLGPDGSARVPLQIDVTAVRDAQGRTYELVAFARDLRQQALHDPLTGLPNRLLFVDRLTTAAARQERAGRGRIAVLFLDLDAFKDVNDTYGHQTGDHALVEVAGRLGKAVRTTDTVARLGGDEFAVICESADADAAELVASRIQQSFKEPLVVDGHLLEMSMSIGVALSPPYDADELLRLADRAMYQAKSAARGRVATYDEGLGR